MAHLVPILGKFSSVAAFATSTHSVHVCEDTLATTIKLESGAIGVANFTFVSNIWQVQIIYKLMKNIVFSRH